MKPEENLELVVLQRAKTTFGAENIAGILEAEGIPTMIEGRNLQDEFAMTQRALGLTGCTVKVRASDLEAAKRILEDARAEGARLEDEPDDRGEDTDATATR